jgi:hypothetical protein
MDYSQTKNTSLAKFSTVLQWKMLVYFMDIWSILRPGHLIFFCDHLVYFAVIWYIFPVLVRCAKKNLATLMRNMHFYSFIYFLFAGPRAAQPSNAQP